MEFFWCSESYSSFKSKFENKKKRAYSMRDHNNSRKITFFFDHEYKTNGFFVQNPSRGRNLWPRPRPRPRCSTPIPTPTPIEKKISKKNNSKKKKVFLNTCFQEKAFINTFEKKNFEIRFCTKKSVEECSKIKF